MGERPRDDHAPGLSAVLADPGVAGWLWPGALGGPRTPRQTAELVRHDAARWQRHGFGPWIVSDRRTGELVGRAGLNRTAVEGEDVVEVEWAIGRRRWGEGLATEIAREAVRVAFDDLGLDEVVAVTLPENAASRRVMEKLGLAYEREVMHAGLPHVLYRRRRGGPRPSGAT